MFKHKKIGFIGAGKVGVTLGKYFISKGCSVAGYLSKNENSALNAANITNTKRFIDICDFLKNCDIIFITVPDGQIKSIYDNIKKHDIAGKFICHTSGALSSEIFEDIENYSAYGYSIHPIHAFSEKNGNISGIENICFTIEGSNRYINEVFNFLKSFGNNTLKINKDNKSLYHASSVFVSNLVLALFEIGHQCMMLSEIDAENGIELLLPLIKANIDNVSKNGIVMALTGPIERNDKQTIEKHLAALPKDYLRIYLDLSIRLIDLAQKKNPDRDYTLLETYLKEKLNNENS